MAPLTAWLPARSSEDFDLIIKIVGPGAALLLKEWGPIAQFLADRGFSVMAQSGRVNGDFGDCVLRVRLATRPFHSMGHGCDVLLHLSPTVPELWRFNLQPGSVLLWEPPAEPLAPPMLPEGVIAYPIPLGMLGAQQGEGLPGKGLAALGVLLHVLGFPEESLHCFSPLVTAPQSFVAGWHFADRTLTKRDAYSLPLSTAVEEAHRIILTPERAIMIGFGVSACGCESTCDQELARSPGQWVTRHTGMAGATVSVLQSDRHPGVDAYRGPQGRVTALLKGDASAIASCLNGFEAPSVLVAADVPDALALVIAGHNMIRSGLSDGVGIMIDDTLARRQQSVEISVVQELFRRRAVIARDPAMTAQPEAQGLFTEEEREGGITVGYVAWGAAQGVVRDAVALCRSFGMNVTGWYPKAIVPFPQEELEVFAKTVDRVVLIESSRTQGYEERLRGACSFPFTVLRPPPGKSLTPMDIFLREGLGAV
ncbi:hypothetical protein ACO9S2_17025 [Nitrospira sp. NS4]|uniref:hypothetical protein n=1 Tax=Nitrospira sp. NS4 TaxID=3414498 RepID=UPI003C30D2CA